MKIPNKVYDVLKWICMIVFPAIITLYSTLADIWNLPYAENVTKTIAAIGTFCGILIGISSHAYYKDAKNEGE